MINYKSLFVLLLISISICIETPIKSQESVEKKKLEVIVNLSKFIDCSENKSFQSAAKLLYIITDYKSCSNFQKISKNLPIFKGWTINCSDKIIDFKEGSVVYITKTKEKCITDLIKLSEKKDILTIAENSTDFCTKGGMINIIENAGQIKFEINYRIIQDKSLDISSKLLALSKIYEE